MKRPLEHLSRWGLQKFGAIVGLAKIFQRKKHTKLEKEKETHRQKKVRNCECNKKGKNK